MSKLYVDPPSLIPWINSKVKNNSLLLLDLVPDLLDQNNLRLDINVVFQSISIRRGYLQEYDFHIGTTGCYIETEFENGIVKDYTREKSFIVSYQNTYTRNRNSSIIIQPILKSGDGSINASLGNLSLEHGDTDKLHTIFTCEESFLQPVYKRNSISWELKIPEKANVVRDYLLGNLFLFVECESFDDNKHGSVSVVPSDVRFFDEHNKLIHSKLKSLIMYYKIWSNGYCIENKRGINVDWELIL